MFDQATLDAAAREKEVDLTTYGRKTGKPWRRPVKRKYDAERPGSHGDEPLQPSEQAVFELVPETS